VGGSSWTGLIGTPGYFAGAAGTVTVPPGAAVLKVWCRSAAGGSLTMFGGQSIPIVANAAPFDLDMKDLLLVAVGAGASAQLVFTGTDSFFVRFVKSGNT
jgi:hypothetical protein